MHWNHSFNLIPYMLQENTKWQCYGHLNRFKINFAKLHCQMTCAFKSVALVCCSQTLFTFDVHQVSNVLLRYLISRALDVAPQIFNSGIWLNLLIGNFKFFSLTGDKFLAMQECKASID